MDYSYNADWNEEGGYTCPYCGWWVRFGEYHNCQPCQQSTGGYWIWIEGTASIPMYPWCNLCMKTFPEDYKYCPYCGLELTIKLGIGG